MGTSYYDAHVCTHFCVGKECDAFNRDAVGTERICVRKVIAHSKNATIYKPTKIGVVFKSILKIIKQLTFNVQLFLIFFPSVTFFKFFSICFFFRIFSYLNTHTYMDGPVRFFASFLRCHFASSQTGMRFRNRTYVPVKTAPIKWTDKTVSPSSIDKSRLKFFLSVKLFRQLC